MSVFTLHAVDSAPQESKSILQDVENKMKFIPNLLRIFSESPVALQSYSSLMRLLKQSSLSTTEKEVVYMTTNYESDCRYCMASHSRIAKRLRVIPEVIQALRDGKPLPDKKLETLRSFTRKIIQSQGFVSEAELNEVMAAGYNQAQILEIMVAITAMTLTSLVTHVSDVPLDDAFKSEEWKHPEKE